MAGNIPGTRYSTKDFINKFGNLAQSSQYRSHIVLPSQVQSFLQSKRIFSREILSETGVLCKATSLPGSSLATHDVKDFYGVTQKHAYARQFDGTIDLTFYIDSNYQMLYLFEFWMEFIMQLNGQNPRSGNSYYKASFPDEYRSSLFVYKFNKDQDSFLQGQERGSITYEFINAFPQNISSVGVSYDASNVLEFTVTFAYERYITDRSGIFRPQIESSNNQATKSAPDPEDNPSSITTSDSGTKTKLVNKDLTEEEQREIAEAIAAERELVRGSLELF
tara:strand:+ start:174 stop:1007 length:834 start_codon:yes stop_codon:yes gene_type:complete